MLLTTTSISLITFDYNVTADRGLDISKMIEAKVENCLHVVDLLGRQRSNDVNLATPKAEPNFLCFFGS